MCFSLRWIYLCHEEKTFEKEKSEQRIVWSWDGIYDACVARPHVSRISHPRQSAQIMKIISQSFLTVETT